MKTLLITLATLAGMAAHEPLAAGTVDRPPGPLPVPPRAELQAMAKDAVLALGRAMAAKDFTEFHRATAVVWQRQTTPEALRGAFQSLIDQGADLGVVRGSKATFTGPPSVDDRGRLVVEGFFPGAPTRVGFTLKYIEEGSAWRLVGINVTVEPAPAAPPSPAAVPSEGELAAMVHGSMKLFAAAVARNDFTEIYSGIASAWKRQMPVEEMSRTFHTFVEKKIPLTVVESSAPVFTDKASVDSDGLLNVAGYYPTRPFRVTFSLRYLSEDSRWRLAGIQVTTKED